MGSKNTGLVSKEKAIQKDIISGFLVFLIALPLCLGISIASGFPAIAGIFTAIIGGILTPLLSNSELTIKGPAAGLIVIVLGCATDFGLTGGANPQADMHAYKMVLAVGFVAGVIQLILGILRAGFISELFPSAAVHGMLAAIGIIIIAKQMPVMLGVNAQGSPFQLLLHMPSHLLNMNPGIALIGAVSLALLFGFPLIKNKYLRLLPAPMLVVLVAIPMGQYLDLTHPHTYTFNHHIYSLDENYLVNVPMNLFSVMTSPDFSALSQPIAWKWVLMFVMIGSIESLLSAKAIDLVDPKKRKTDMSRDLMAIGLGNAVSAAIGGLPMISEIVRSRANLDNGAQSRFSNMFHGFFLLLFVSLVPALLHQIPLAALAAMLVYTGFRLAHPREFHHVYKVGTEQLLVFVSTIVGVLATDLLVGVILGVLLESLIHLKNGAPMRSLFSPKYHVSESENEAIIIPQDSAVFTNWLALKNRIETHGLKLQKNVRIDLSHARLVDHTVMTKLEECSRDFNQNNLTLIISGLESHRAFSKHKLAARRKVANP